MTTIDIRLDYTVDPHQVLSFTNETGFYLDGANGPGNPTLTNYGSVTVAATGGGTALGIQNGQSSYYSGSFIRNEVGATFSVNSSGGGAIGFSSPSWSADLYNDGSFTVSALGAAVGVHTSDDGDFIFSNTGTFRVTGNSAIGADIDNGGTFENSGIYLVQAASGGATGVFLGGESAFHNSGSINIIDSTDVLDSVGVVYSGYSPIMQVFTNSGSIQADYAIRDDAYFPQNLTTAVNLNNTGSIAGIVELGHGNDAIHNSGHITGAVYLGDGVDLYDGTGGVQSGAVYGGLGNDTLSGTAGADVIYGDQGADNGFSGQDGDDTLNGNDGNDLLYGEGGADTLNGGAGNDFLEGGAGNDTLNGGSGTDAASYASAPSGVTVNLTTAGPQNTGGAGTDILVSIEKLVGSSFADTLTANTSGATLNGGPGGDDLIGGPGSDILNGGAASDFADYSLAASAVTVSLAITTFQSTGGGGSDQLVGIEKLVGSGFNDHLTGDTGPNALYGLAGADVITGGAGQDSLGGGAGNDTFVFVAVGDSTVAAPDTILDFQSGDRIDLSAIDANTATPGDQAFHLGATGGHSGDIVVGAYDAPHNRTVVSLYVDADATPDAAILLNGDHHALAAGDFIL